LFLLNQPNSQTVQLSKSLIDLVDGIILCKNCHNISDLELCEICSNVKRNKSIVCVVEDIRDVMAIESTGQFNGVYHVLGGKISPIEGIGPNQLNISSLIEKLKSINVSELIFALSATMEGDTTNFYIFKQIQNLDLKITTIARGVSVGNELEYTDEVTLGRSIIKRIPFENSIKT
jgi:recombination protein RecR